MLRDLAGTEGVIADAGAAGNWLKVENRIQEIRRVLRSHFGIAEDPLPFQAGTGYHARFVIARRPSSES